MSQSNRRTSLQARFKNWVELAIGRARAVESTPAVESIVTDRETVIDIPELTAEELIAELNYVQLTIDSIKKDFDGIMAQCDKSIEMVGTTLKLTPVLQLTLTALASVSIGCDSIHTLMMVSTGALIFGCCLTGAEGYCKLKHLEAPLQGLKGKGVDLENHLTMLKHSLKKAGGVLVQMTVIINSLGVERKKNFNVKWFKFRVIMLTGTAIIVLAFIISAVLQMKKCPIRGRSV